MTDGPDPSPASAPSDRYCDLVMKGGITSGVVYPLAIHQLAGSYRFKNIGGTSAGAIAAVVTDAAEYRRRHGSTAGFDALKELPQALGEPVGGRPRLLTLFKPEPGTLQLFQALLSMLNRTSTDSRWVAGVARFVHAYLSLAVLGLALALLLAWAAGVGAQLRSLWVIVPLAVVGIVAAVAFGVYHAQAYRPLSDAIPNTPTVTCSNCPAANCRSSSPPA